MANAINRPMTATEWGLLIALALLWGATFFFVEVALVELGPWTLVLARVGLAAGALLIAAGMLGHRLPLDGQSLRAFLVMGLLNNALPFSLIFWGQTEITGGLAAVLNATTPVFTVLLAHVVTADEKLTPGRLGGVAAGIAGVAVMVGPDALRGVGLGALAQFAVLGAALCYAVAGLYGRRFRAQPALVTAAGQATAATLLMAPAALVVERPWTLPVPGLATIGAVAGLALASTALAYVLYFRILKTAGATNLLLVTLLIPVAAIALGTAILGEIVTARQLAGFAIIALGLGLIDGRPARALRWRGGRPGRA